MSNEFRNFARPELREPAIFSGSVAAIEPVEEVVELQSELTANVTEIEPLESLVDEMVEEVEETEVVEESIETTVEETVEEPEVVEEVVETPEEELETTKGKVVDCKLLNVRVEPTMASDVISIIPEDSIVTIIEDSVNGWYGVITEDGAIGYCMKKFIAVI